MEKEITKKELKTMVYEMGIDEAYDNKNISIEELLDFYYDYGREIYGDNLPKLKVIEK